MGPVLSFGGGCLFPLYSFPLSFIVIYSFLFLKCLGFKNVDIHSLFYLFV